jgi:hypothetical protein
MRAMEQSDAKAKEHLQNVEQDTSEHEAPPQVLRVTVLPTHHLRNASTGTNEMEER